MTTASEQASNQEKTSSGSKVSVIAAIVGNVLVGLVKFVAAAITRSTAMFSEGIHSIVDSGNGLLMLLGMHRANRKPDLDHPFGYGKELYFWTMMVSLLIFALGGLVSIYEGVNSIKAADMSRLDASPLVNYVVLALSAIIEGSSLSVAIKNFNCARGAQRPFAFIRDTKDPSLFTVVLEDSAAELGLIFAFLGVFFGHLLHNPYLDGVASLLIGVLLCVVAITLLRETKELLLGEGMEHEDVEEMRAIVEADRSVDACGRILTMYMGPHDLVVALDVAFAEGASAHEVLAAVDRVEDAIRTRFPETGDVFVESEGLRQVRKQHDELDEMIEQVELEEEGESR
jgi:cation diffusion facilitator family transporter